MNVFKANKIMDRLDKMIENAMNGNPIEKDFDETKMAALETKLSRYLTMTKTGSLQLEEEKKRISTLISDISHQTKTPIANILLYSQLLEESNLSEKNRLCVESLTEQAEKLNFLIASLVKASRLETGIISVSPIHQELQPLLDNVVKQVKTKKEKKDITLHSSNTTVSAIFDLKWTTEALFNIVDNAIKYTPHQGVVSISVIPYEIFCRIDVNDNGIGIEEDEIANIFSRFYRSSSLHNEEGVGIGLYLAREIIAKEGGYIKVHSTLNKGSTFSVFLQMNK